jgi:hypothetical protein
MTSTMAPTQLVLEKALPKFNKMLQVEFEDKKFIKAIVDGEELTPSKFKPRIGNVHINDPAIELSGDDSYCVKVLDSQGAWWFGYPSGTKCP